MRALVLAAMLLGGCNLVLGIRDLDGPTGDAGDDGPLDTPGPGTVRLVGQVVVIDLNVGFPLANTRLEVLELPQLTPVGEVITDDDGNYEVVVATPGATPELVLRTFDPSGTAPETWAYPPPLTRPELGFNVPVFSRNFIDAMAEQTGEPRGPDSAFLFLQTVDSSLTQPRPGVRISTEPEAKLFYADQNGFPNPQLSSTSAAGVGYVFNLLAFSVRVLASSQLIGVERSLPFIPGGTSHVVALVLD
jgi:hypothetical protein